MSRADRLEQLVTRGNYTVAVIDVQNDFCAVEGAFYRQGANLSHLSQVLPRIAAFLTNIRRLGGKIIFTKHHHHPGQLSPAMLDRNRLLFGGEGFPIPGSWGEAFCEPVSPHPAEPVIIKYQYSAFSNPEFRVWLDQFETKILVLTGVLTNVCVETTARDAYAAGYYPVVIEDCVASDSMALHRATLTTLKTFFGWGCLSEEFVRLWTT